VNRRAPLIAGLVFVVLAVAAVLLLVMPKMSDVGEAQDRLEGFEQDEVALQAELSRLQEAAENAPQLRRELAKFRRAVPPVADLPGLINLLQTAADTAGVDFFSIAPGTPVVASQGAAEVPATIQVVGGFFPVDEFLFRLETLQRASKVPTVTVAEGPDGLPQINVQLEVRFYTTDVEAGPGAAPAAPAASPAASPAPGASPSPGASPTAPAGTPAAVETPGA
jgi:Tfp pilus assembly protein PilO